LREASSDYVPVGIWRELYPERDSGREDAETEFSFNGEQGDPNGLDFLRARYYDPEIRCFLSCDPVGGGYAYAGTPSK
jgi:RHS repeat-associated protein